MLSIQIGLRGLYIRVPGYKQHALFAVYSLQSFDGRFDYRFTPGACRWNHEEYGHAVFARQDRTYVISRPLRISFSVDIQ